MPAHAVPADPGTIGSHPPGLPLPGSLPTDSLLADSLLAGSNAADSIGALLSAIDPSHDPAVAFLTARAGVVGDHWSHHLRWSVDAGVAYPYGGSASISGSAHLTVPLHAFTEASDRADRARVERALAVIDRERTAREVTYGALDLACRWGYLHALEPVLARLAATDAARTEIWRVRRVNAAAEGEAVAIQLDAIAPELRRALQRHGGFLCRLPAVPVEPALDGLDGHPSLRRLALEDEQMAFQAEILTSTGGPELTVDGSVRHALGGTDAHAHIRVAARIPFATPVGYGSITAETDAAEARVRVQVDARARPEAPAGTIDLDARRGRELAALRFRAAGAIAAYRTVRAQAGAAWGELPPILRAAFAACKGVCRAPEPATHDPRVLQMLLNAFGLEYETARAQLELMRVLAIDPTTLQRDRAARRSRLSYRNPRTRRPAVRRAVGAAASRSATRRATAFPGDRSSRRRR